MALCEIVATRYAEIISRHSRGHRIGAVGGAIKKLPWMHFRLTTLL